MRKPKSTSGCFTRSFYPTNAWRRRMEEAWQSMSGDLERLGRDPFQQDQNETTVGYSSRSKSRRAIGVSKNGDWINNWQCRFFPGPEPRFHLTTRCRYIAASQQTGHSVLVGAAFFGKMKVGSADKLDAQRSATPRDLCSRPTLLMPMQVLQLSRGCAWRRTGNSLGFLFPKPALSQLRSELPSPLPAVQNRTSLKPKIPTQCFHSHRCPKH